MKINRRKCLSLFSASTIIPFAIPSIVMAKNTKDQKPSILQWQFLDFDTAATCKDVTLVRNAKTLIDESDENWWFAGKFGLQTWSRLVDALYRPLGSIACRVKITESTTRYIEMIDVDDILHEFACNCVEETFKRNNIRDGIYWEAINSKRKWMDKKISAHELNSVAETVNNHIEAHEEVGTRKWHMLFSHARGVTDLCGANSTSRVMMRFSKEGREIEEWTTEQDKILRSLIEPLFHKV